MDNFEAFLDGAGHDYPGSHLSVDPDDYNIPPANHEAFLLGAEISCAHFMIVSCDSNTEFERDIKNYNDVAVSVDEFFGKDVVEPYKYGNILDVFTAVNPHTSERVRLFAGAHL